MVGWAIGISLLVHGAAIPLWVFASPSPTTVDDNLVLKQDLLSTETGLYTTCESEVVIATLAQATLSLTPYCKNRIDCLTTNLQAMKKGWGDCNQVEAPLEVAFVNSETLAKIVPMPLTTHITPEEQKQFERKKEISSIREQCQNGGTMLE